MIIFAEYCLATCLEFVPFVSGKLPTESILKNSGLILF